MKKIYFILLTVAILLLSACAGEQPEEKQIESSPEEEKIGFSVTGDTIEEAANVPEEEKKAIIEAFDTYIATFNNQDIDGYIGMIGESYDLEEERAFLEEHFESYEQTRTPENVTIVKYSGEEAQVFANIDNYLKQLSTGFETSDKIKQVTVFAKENGDWKVKSVHSIGESPEEQ